jgi:hypothetical protein
MRIARIVALAIAMAFSAGVALTAWTPVNAEDSSGGTTSKDKSKAKNTKTAKKASPKTAKTTGTAPEATGKGEGGRY